MSRTTDTLLFAILLMLFAIFQRLPLHSSGLVALGGLLIGLIAFVASVLSAIPTDDQSG